MLLRRAASATAARCRLRAAAGCPSSSLGGGGVRALHTTFDKKKMAYLPAAKESRKSLVKIVATIGPASEQFEPLQAVRTRTHRPDPGH